MSWLEHSPPTSIDCDEFIIRQYRLSDAATLRNTIRENTEHLRPWMPWIKHEPQTLEQKEELILLWGKEWIERSGFTMGVFLGGDLVAGTGFHVRGPVGVLEIGYWVSVHHVGRGIATSLARRLTDVAWNIPEVTHVEIHHDKANIASERVPEKLGYHFIKTYEREPDAPGESGEGLVWSVTREQWLNAKQ